jgi:predicted AlkP superfamily phosphohydrolase/phosphomutase
LIVGIDGATFDLLNPWIEAGELPHLSRFVERGAHATLWAWPNTNSAAAWTSMVTGCNAGKHGVFDFGDMPPRVGRRWQPMTAAKRRREPFWCHLSDAGQSVGVINVPISYPADRVRGFMVSGMDTPSVGSAGFTHPPELAEELRRRAYVIDIENLGPLARQRPARAAAALEDLVARRVAATLHLMQTRDWDALMTVFVATDRAQHHFWPRANANAGSEGGGDGEILLRIYRRIDEFIGEAMKAAGDEALVIVVSDHGFGASRPGRKTLNQLFAELGLLRFNEGRRRWGSSLRTGMLGYGRKLIPRNLQRPLAMRLARLRSRVVTESRFTNIDWGRTRVFAGLHGSQVYVNLAGRQVDGTVAEEEKAELLRRVREILLDLTDPVSGARVVRSAALSEEIYEGPQIGDAPDITVEWDFDAVGERIRYRAGGRDIVCAGPTAGAGVRWIGEHRPDGVFLAVGPMVRRAAISRVSLYDIAPTVLYAQGVPVPQEMDGRVLTEIFREDCQREHATVRQAAAAEASAHGRKPDGDRLRDDEAALIEERLRGLGYIE